MQLVLHSPFGARINRGLGLALRKKFCRRFNFELQAAATDDAVILSLGPHHSFPLAEVPGYLSSRSLPSTLEHAILDSPMFQSRWRWNLNRSLMVLRWRGGRRNPPPMQRMEADDLLAAVFPQAAACQDNIVGPVEIPDHLLVRQTIGDTLHEAIDMEGVVSVVAGIEQGLIRVHCQDTTEPSVLSHEIVTARPYAFLDDEEFQNRRTNAVQLRRGLAVDLSAIGSLEPDAIAAVHDEIDPVPGSPDELHDVLSSAVVLHPRAEWAPLFEALVADRRSSVMSGGETPLWVTAECRPVAARGLAGEDEAVVRIVRGHLELAGITTVTALAERTTLPPARVAYALAALQQEGFAFEGSYSPGAVGTEWVARRLLARMHAYSRRTRRRSVEPLCAQDFMRFLLAWQHVAPGSQLEGRKGLITVLEQLQGYEAAAVAWEPELISRRLVHYRPEWLDSLCHSGDSAWLRITPRALRDGAAPSKATPISVVFRSDLSWLLAAVRSGADAPEVPEPAEGEMSRVLEVLSRRGACFPVELVAATRCRPADVERALWEGVARGLVMCDGFEAIRARVSAAPAPARARRFSPGLRPARPTARSAGRWALVPDAALADVELDGHDLAETVAEQLLHRWGVVFRDLATRDSLRIPWREVLWALRRLEDRGLVRGGRFVAGFSGEQYALPDAVEQLEAVRHTPRSGLRVTVNATDPLNLVGTIIPGQTVPAVRTGSVTYVDGIPLS
ncbi:MAG: hypothetical protein JO337_06045, partial [Acidimicrobiales bacterium]|nr:hypothetical protein [Acidimicrobiales bacterium]